MIVTKIKIEIQNEDLVIVCPDNKTLHIDTEQLSHDSGISMPIDDVPKFVDSLMFIHNMETRFNREENEDR
jgi:hypothetical protein